MEKLKKLYNSIFIIVIIVLLLSLFYEYFVGNFLYLKQFCFNYLEAYVQTQLIRLEDSKGFIDLYYVQNIKGKTKERITASYPIEMIVIYDINDFKNISLLKSIIDYRFTNCSILSDVQMCKLLVIDEKGKFDYIRGEIFKGKYQGKLFKFMYFIQDVYGQRLDEIDKFWPPLTRIINKIQMSKSAYGKIVSQHLNDGHLSVKLRLEPKTLKIRTGISTAFTLEKNLILNYYAKNNNLKPMVVISYDGGYQLIAIDLPMNQYYVDLFKKPDHNLDYLKKIYKIEIVEKRWSFMKKWLRKYDSYDRKYRI